MATNPNRPSDAQTGAFDTIEDVEIAFLPNLKEALVGVAGVLSGYRVTIDFPKQEFTLSRP
jgi:hypothetical protein